MSGIVRHIIFHIRGNAWVPTLDVLEQPGVAEHFGYIKSLCERGDVIAAGPFTDAEAGGMLVLHERLSAKDALAIVQDDPGIKSGLIGFHIRPWLVTLEITSAQTSLPRLQQQGVTR